MTAIFIGLITFVAGLNILVVLAMTVTEKARDIAVLMSMGARREQIRNIFIWQGLAVGAFGLAIGLVAGVLAWRGPPTPAAGFAWTPRFTRSPTCPFTPTWFDALWIIAATLLISVAGDVLIPARAASRGSCLAQLLTL